MPVLRPAFGVVLIPLLAGCGAWSLRPGETRLDCGFFVDQVTCGAAASIARRENDPNAEDVRYTSVAATFTQHQYTVVFTSDDGSTRRFTVEGLLTGKQAVAWTWNEPDHYSFTTEMWSFAMGGGPVTIEVRDGKVVEASLDGRLITDTEDIPTIAIIQERATQAIERGGNVAVRVADDGHPTFIAMDPMPNAIDDESTVWITEYEAQ